MTSVQNEDPTDVSVMRHDSTWFSKAASPFDQPGLSPMVEREVVLDTIVWNATDDRKDRKSVV